MSKFSFESFVVRGESGSVNMEASQAKLNEVFKTFVLQTEETREAVFAVFSANKGARVNMDAIITHASKLITGGEKMENFSQVSKMIKEFVSENTGTQEEGALFGTKKGKGGGTWLWADYKEKESTEAK